MSKFLFFFAIGAIIAFLASMFYIGSDEQLKDAIENHLIEFIISKTLFSFFASLIWSVVSCFLYRVIFINDSKKISIGYFLMFSIVGYFILSLSFVLIFICIPR